MIRLMVRPDQGLPVRFATPRRLSSAAMARVPRRWVVHRRKISCRCGASRRWTGRHRKGYLLAGSVDLLEVAETADTAG